MGVGGVLKELAYTELFNVFILSSIYLESFMSVLKSESPAFTMTGTLH